MARTLAKVTLVALVILGFVAAASRYAVGALVASDGFRETAVRQLEKALRPFVPQALVAVEESELAGVGEVVLRRMTVRSEQKIDAAVAVQELRVRPRWATVFLPGPTELEVLGRLAGEGSATLLLSLPLKALVLGNSRDADATVELTGAFERADAPTLLALVFASGHGRAPRLARGFIDGELALAKGIGEERATAKKTGHATLRFSDAAYELKGQEEALAPFDAALDLRDYTVKIAQPIVVETQTHESRAAVSGALLLPHRAEQNVGWDLELTADGKPGFKDDLAQIFRCQAPPAGPRFRIVGPIADARCQAVVAGSAKGDHKKL